MNWIIGVVLLLVLCCAGFVIVCSLGTVDDDPADDALADRLYGDDFVNRDDDADL